MFINTSLKILMFLCALGFVIKLFNHDYGKTTWPFLIIFLFSLILKLVRGHTPTAGELPSQETYREDHPDQRF